MSEGHTFFELGVIWYVFPFSVTCMFLFLVTYVFPILVTWGQMCFPFRPCFVSFFGSVMTFKVDETFVGEFLLQQFVYKR